MGWRVISLCWLRPSVCVYGSLGLCTGVHCNPIIMTQSVLVTELQIHERKDIIHKCLFTLKRYRLFQTGFPNHLIYMFYVNWPCFFIPTLSVYYTKEQKKKRSVWFISVFFLTFPPSATYLDDGVVYLTSGAQETHIY